MQKNMIFEKEIEIPENWESNTILIKDGKGKIIEREIPDDTEEE